MSPVEVVSNTALQWGPLVDVTIHRQSLSDSYVVLPMNQSNVHGPHGPTGWMAWTNSPAGACMKITQKKSAGEVHALCPACERPSKGAYVYVDVRCPLFPHMDPACSLLPRSPDP